MVNTRSFLNIIGWCINVQICWIVEFWLEGLLHTLYKLLPCLFEMPTIYGLPPHAFGIVLYAELYILHLILYAQWDALCFLEEYITYVILFNATVIPSYWHGAILFLFLLPTASIKGKIGASEICHLDYLLGILGFLNISRELMLSLEYTIVFRT